MIHCQCLCVDLRGHGDSKVDDEDDLSADTLAKLVNNIFVTKVKLKFPNFL